ncbi:MAG: sulfurtransferase [Solirubrobacteraceae bacterium]
MSQAKAPSDRSAVGWARDEPGSQNVVSPEWVAEHAGDEGVRVLDTRSDVMDYFPGHVPNAVHLSDFSLRGLIARLPVQYHQLAELAGLFGRAGVSDADHVVVYAEGEQTIGATTALYALEPIGHEQANYMDGGWPAYKASQAAGQAYPLQLSQEGTLTPRNNRGIDVAREEVKTHLEGSKTVIIDSRPSHFYLAPPPHSWMRNGHIPGAINIDWHGLMDPGNMALLRPLEQLEAIYSRAGVARAQDIIVTCGTSREASMECFVLKHVLGFPRVRRYEDSWME